MNKIAIIIIATNSYFILGLRFIKKFMHYYNGNSIIKFYFFSDHDPRNYFSSDINLEYIYTKHNNWLDATNSKFYNIKSLENKDEDYFYYFDADTNIMKTFDETWFLGESVGAEHFGNKSWLKNGAGFDKNPRSKAYVPEDSKLDKIYYMGAFLGGKKEKIMKIAEILLQWQLEDKKINYEPGVNDESYINAYFHYNPPKIVKIENFPFLYSDKGGMQDTRNPLLDIEYLKKQVLDDKHSIFEIKGKNIIFNK